MSKVLMVIADRDFRDEELYDTKAEIEFAGHKVVTVNKTGANSVGSLGGEGRVDGKLKDVKPEEFDAVVFVGGSGSEQYFNDKVALDLVNKLYEQRRIVAAICIAPNILANAGILSGKKATVFGDGKDIAKKGAVFVEEPVVVDGKIVTANGPKAAKEFGKKIAELLKD